MKDEFKQKKIIVNDNIQDLIFIRLKTLIKDLESYKKNI